MLLQTLVSLLKYIIITPLLAQYGIRLHSHPPRAQASRYE